MLSFICSVHILHDREGTIYILYVVSFFRPHSFFFIFVAFCCHCNTWQLPYILSIEYDVHQGALLPPHLNIPAKGFVPVAVETFTLHLPCAGNISDEVPIAINLFVQGPPKRNDTRLIFKRNKICLKGKSFTVWFVWFKYIALCLMQLCGAVFVCVCVGWQ